MATGIAVRVRGSPNKAVSVAVGLRPV